MDHFSWIDQVIRRRERRRMRTAVFLALACLLSGSQGFGQQQQQLSREREAVRRAQAATQKAEQENAQLQDQNAKLEKEKQDLSGKLKASQKLKSQVAAAKKKEAEQLQEIEQLRQDARVDKARIGDLEAKLQGLNAQIAEGQEQNRQLAGRVKTTEGRLKEQREIIGRQAQTIQGLDEKNLKLYRLNNELIDKYNKKGAWDALLQREPFTQIKDVQIQSLLQEYRDKNDALKNEKPQLQQ